MNDKIFCLFFYANFKGGGANVRYKILNSL